jgi:hypothetical protein
VARGDHPAFARATNEVSSVAGQRVRAFCSRKFPETTTRRRRDDGVGRLRRDRDETSRRAMREGRWHDTHLLKSSTRYSISCGRGERERVRTGADFAFARSGSDRTTGGERASPHAPSSRSRTPAASWRPSPRGRAWTCRRGCPAAPL